MSTKEAINKINKNVSASNLIKRSAAQTIYYKSKTYFYNQNKPATKAQIKGNQNAEKVSTSEYIEMRGTYVTPDQTLIHFAFDEIKKKENKTVFIEHKHIDNEKNLEDWYIQFSILQVAFYQSLAQDINHYVTAKFLRKTHEIKQLSVDNKRVFKLVFSNDEFKRVYKIKVTDPEKIIEYYLNKNKHSLLQNPTNLNKDYSIAREYDAEFKGCDWDNLKQFIKYKRI